MQQRNRPFEKERLIVMFEYLSLLAAIILCFLGLYVAVRLICAAFFRSLGEFLNSREEEMQDGGKKTKNQKKITEH